MVLVSEVLAHIGRINSPLNLANTKSQKLKFLRNTGNTAPDNERVLNFMHNHYWRIFLLNERSRSVKKSVSNQNTYPCHLVS